MYYNKKELSEIQTHKFHFLIVEEKENILTVTLSREKKKNALHPKMVEELTFALEYAKITAEIWGVVIQSKGDIFCSGMDLKAMRGEIEPHHSSIPDSSEKILLGEIFQNTCKPIVSIVEGDVYAGGFFFLTGSTYVVSHKDAKFGLPEVKRGLFPFQVMDKLFDIMPKRKVMDWCISADIKDGNKAFDLGLITHLVEKENLENTASKIIETLKQNSPSAIRLGLEAAHHLNQKPSQGYLFEMLEQIKQTEDAKEGLAAFKEKRKPNWRGK